jgi:hypothetical protein
VHPAAASVFAIEELLDPDEPPPENPNATAAAMPATRSAATAHAQRGSREKNDP